MLYYSNFCSEGYVCILPILTLEAINQFVFRAHPPFLQALIEAPLTFINRTNARQSV